MEKSLQTWISRAAWICGGAAVALTLPMAPALAQTANSVGAAAPDTSTDQGAKLEEIIVTAQKRTEDLQQVPISAQVVTGQLLSDENYNSLQELTQIVPSVFVSPDLFSNDLFIRGVGSGASPDFDQSVATFDDDIYHGRSRTTDATFLDLDRIEILKGPQSTFFGNNAIAGALNIVTKKPGDSFDASGRLLYGQFGQYAAEGAIGGPITDTFGARLAVMRNGESGWVENVTDGRYAPDENNEAARLTLAFDPTKDLSAILKIEGSQNRTSGSIGLPQQLVNCSLPTALLGLIGGGCAPGLPSGLDNNRNAQLPGQGTSLSTFEDVLTVNYHQWGQTFTSVTGFNNYHFNLDYDLSGGPTFSTTGNLPEKYHQFSQEFRVASPTDQPIEYLVGAYFQTDQLDWAAEANLPLLDGVATALGIPPQYQPIGFANEFSQGERIYSAFGSLSWNVTDRLKLSTGLRASDVKKDFTGSVPYGTSTQYYGGLVPVPPAVEAIDESIFGPAGSQSLSRSDRALMPSAGIQYKVDAETMIYFTYARGFKAGGYNGVTPLAPAADAEFGPEYVNSYELGLKSKWFDDTVLVNLDVFREDFSDLQVSAVVCAFVNNLCQDQVRNAAVSRSQGVELEGQWAISKDFRLSTDITYLNAYYVSYPNAAPTTLQHDCSSDYVLPYCSAFPNPTPNVYANISGQPTLNSPRWSGSISGRYSLSLPSDLKFTAELSPYFTSSYNVDPQLVPLGLPVNGTASYVRLDARLTLGQFMGRWAVDLIGKNLTNQVIAAATGFGAGSVGSKEEPRNVAAQVRFSW